MLHRVLPITALCLSPGLALSETFRVGEIAVSEAFAIETPAAAKAGAGYMTLTNTGSVADRLLRVDAEFPMVMLHATSEQDGVARMEHQSEGVFLNPGETVVLEPGGLHIMFMGLPTPFVAGETVPATLVFENAGTLDVTFPIETRDAYLERTAEGGS